jgi:hypothetical protein
MYLKQAGYPEKELDAVKPLLEEARENFGLERQLKAGGPVPQWSPAQ